MTGVLAPGSPAPGSRGGGAGDGQAAASGLRRARRPRTMTMPGWLLSTALPLLAIHAVAVLLRFWHLNAVGFNSDEAVYAGTAAALAGDPVRASMFPVFRAHPVLFQMLVSWGFHAGAGDWFARAVAAGVGVAAVTATYLLGRRLYGNSAGLVAALLVAVMPYHVVVSRQVLLDGLMTLCATATVYCVVRYAETIALAWLLAAGAMMGLTVLAKETSLVLLGGLYTFFALTPVVRLRARHLVAASAAMATVIAAVPIALASSGRSTSGYLVWQMFRRPNHDMLFYVRVLPAAIGLAVLAVALAGLVWLRRENTWRERLLLSWAGVAIVFFTLWPVKGYQYLLPVVPVVAVLAGRALARVGELAAPRRARWVPRVAAVTAVLAVAASLAVPAWRLVNPSSSPTFLAGTGGLPGGREAGEWVAGHVPAGAQLLAIGPSMANVLQFYGGRRVYALSVSPNPLVRNPAYVPVTNPDRAVRDGEFQYVVWDSYTAARASFFADKARVLIDKYHGVAMYTATVAVTGPSGHPSTQPVIIIYQVRA